MLRQLVRLNWDEVFNKPFFINGGHFIIFVLIYVNQPNSRNRLLNFGLFLWKLPAAISVNKVYLCERNETLCF